MVSSTNFADSLTTTNSSSGHYTLVAISIFLVVLLPVILLYQSWTYHVFRARLGQAEPASNPVELLARRTRENPTP
jgi:cytochrome bd ubiquinol oxidase subunit II